MSAAKSELPMDSVPEDDSHAIRNQWEQEQLELKKQIILKNDFDFKIPNRTDHKLDAKELKYIGGMDISFVKDSNVDACANLVVLSYPELEIVYESNDMIKLQLPYISGFLAFREVPFLLRQLEKLEISNPELMPQIIMCDGNGTLHPRGFGVACHLGVLTGIPTIGVAKTFLMVDSIDFNMMKDLSKKLDKGGAYQYLVGASGRVWGALYRSLDSTTNPIFISPGHKIDLETTIEIVGMCCKYRIPEPVRMADIKSREYLKKLGYN